MDPIEAAQIFLGICDIVDAGCGEEDESEPALRYLPDRENLQSKRIWVPELNRWLRMTLSCKAIKTINKNGAHATLKEAGLI